MTFKKPKYLILLIVSFTLYVSSAWSAQFSQLSHEVLIGDYNGDGYDDIYLRANEQIQSIPIPYNINIDLSLKGSIADILLISDSNGNYAIVYNPNKFSLSNINWSPANYDLLVSDVNSDGLLDVLVQSREIGSLSYLVLATDNKQAPVLSKVIIREQTYTDEDVNSRTSIDSSAGNDYSIDNGTFVGAIEGNFSVTSTGKPNYVIPINALPSVQNILPDMSLVYTGGTHNDILGVGWAISGLSSITRCTSTLAQEGYIDGVNYNNIDTFCLNGQHLILASAQYSYGDNEAVYRTENESFAKIVSYGSHGSGPQHFKVWHKDGTIEEYGNTINSRRLNDAGTDVQEWSISKTEDREANSVNYDYNTSNTTGRHYIKSLTYSGNGSIHFNYESRPDKIDTNRDGLKEIIDQRISEIQTKLSNTIVRTYNLNYTVSGSTQRSRLTSISECIGSHCLPMTQIVWDPANEEVNFISQTKQTDSSSYPSGRNFDNQQYHLADVNGDAKADLIWTYRDGNTIGRILYLANVQGNGFAASPTSSATETGFSASIINTEQQHYVTGDVNGDGKSDLIWIAKHQGDVYRVIYLANSTGTGFVSQGYEVDSNNEYTQYTEGQYLSGDVNGDGRADLIWVYTYQSKIGRAVYLAGMNSNGSIALGKTSFELDTDYTPFYYKDKSFHTGDVNGDGKSDLVWTFVHQNNFYQVVYLANANGSAFYKVSAQKDPDVISTFSAFKDTKTHLSDVNADGRDDLVWTYNNNNRLGRALYLATPKGTSFEKASNSLDSAGTRNPDDFTNSQTNMADLNGDGKADIVYTYTDNQSFGWVAYLANVDGSGFNEESSDFAQAANPNYQNQSYLLGDVNADGKTDLVWSYNDQFNNLERLALTLPQSNPDHVTDIINGLGHYTSIKYKYLGSGDTDFYNKGAISSYPVKTDTGRSYIVSSVEQSNGIGGLNKWNYKYVAARTNLRGRGFLGFEKRITIDQQTGFITTETYNQNFPFIGMMNSTLVQQANLNPVEKVFNHWKSQTITHPSSKTTEFRYLKDEAALKYDLSDAVLTFASLTIDIYDLTFGNLTSKVTKTGKGFNGSIDSNYNPNGSYSESNLLNIEKTITVDTNYLNDPDDTWRIGFIETQEKTFSAPNETNVVVKTTRTPYNTETFLTRTETQFADTDKWFTSTFTRDGYGNITQTVVTAADIDNSTINSQTTSINSYIDGLYPSSITNPKLHDTSYAYNKRIGKVSQITDPNSLITNMIYDDMGRIVYEKSAAGADKTYIYEYCNSPCNVTNGVYAKITSLTHKHQSGKHGSPRIKEYYDSLDRLVRTETVNLTGRTILQDIQYDTQGRVANKSEPYFSGETVHWNNYYYDNLDRMTSESLANGTTRTYAYRSDPTYSRKTTVTETILVPGQDNKVHTSSLHYNSVDQLIRTIDSGSVVTAFKYDAQGEIRWAQVDNNPATTITLQHDVAGNRILLNDPDAGTIRYDFDGLSRLRRLTQQPGSSEQITTSSYDVLDRLVQRIDNDNSNTTTANWYYDSAAYGKGKLSSRSAADFSESYEYDKYSRLSKTTTRLLNETDPKIITMTYDGFDRELTKTYPSGSHIQHSYNQRGFLVKTTDIANGKTYRTVNYTNQYGDITDELLGNGIKRIKDFDPSSARLRLLTAGTTDDPGKIQNLSLTWESTGNLKSRSSQSSQIRGESLTENLTYDNLNRLTRSDITGLIGGTRVINYHYNDLGNLTHKTGVSDIDGYAYGSNGGGVHAVSSVTLNGNITNYHYDNKGNIRIAGDRILTYTVFNKPATITKTAISRIFKYGPDRKRFYQSSSQNGKTITTKYYANKQYEVVNDGEYTRNKSYIADYLINTQVIKQNSSAKSTEYTYLHRDHLDSVESMTNGSGELISRMNYEPFGTRREGNWETTSEQYKGSLDQLTFETTTHGYTDHEMLDSVELIHMNGRIYDPVIGRFMSTDENIQFPELSQSYNRYTYVGNNPLSYNDPTGEIIPLLFVAVALADRGWSAYTAVTEGVNDAKVMMDKSSTTSQKIAAGLNTASNIAVPSVIKKGYGALKKWKKAKGAVSSQKGKPAAQSKGLDKNTEKAPQEKKPCGCFAAGTLVLTKDGYSPIETIQLGDMVAAKDEVTGEIAYKAIEKRYVYDERKLYQLSLLDADNKTVIFTVTDDHPFKIKGHDWLTTANLKPGMQIDSFNDKAYTVNAITSLGKQDTTYNFEVADYHTYFVGTDRVWVHNGGPCDNTSKNTESSKSVNDNRKTYKDAQGVLRTSDGRYAKIEGPTPGMKVNSSRRKKILERDRNADGSWSCRTCGQNTKNPANIHTGHKKARAHGGGLEDSNLECQGAACNLSRGSGSNPKPGRTCADRGSCGAPYGRTD